MTTQNHRHHGYDPLEVVLTTASMDGESGRIVLDLGTGLGTWRAADVDDGRGLLPYLGVGDADAVRRAIPAWPTTTVTHANGTTTTYDAGTGGRPLVVHFLMPELVRTISWCKALALNEGIRLSGLVDVRGLVAATLIRLYGGRITQLGLPWSCEGLELTQPVTPLALTGTLASQTASVWATLGSQAGQGYAAGTVGLQSIGAAAGVLDLSAYPNLKRVWAGNSGLTRVLFSERDVLEELVLPYNSLGTYAGLPAWNRLPLSLRLLALGTTGTSSNTIRWQILAAGGSALAAGLNLSGLTQLQWLLANGAGLSGELRQGNALEEIWAARNGLTSLVHDATGQMLAPNVRILCLSRYDGLTIAGTGQVHYGGAIPVQDFTGAVGLRAAYCNDCGTEEVVFPQEEGLLHWQGYHNAITSITRAGGGANVIPGSLQIFRLGGGSDVAPAWSAQLLGASSATSSYGQVDRVSKMVLNLTGGDGLVFIDARDSNVNSLTPQANQAATRKLVFSPIGSYSYVSGHNVTTEGNNNEFTSAGALNLSGYTAATHLIANHCKATNASIVLPGNPGLPGGAGAWAQDPANPILQLELSGNNFTVCPFGSQDYKNCLSLELAGHRTAGYPKLASIPTSQMTGLLYKSVHHQGLTGPLHFIGNSALQVFYGHANKQGAAAGEAPTLIAPAMREFVFDDQTPAAGLVNRLDFSPCTSALRVLSAKNARLAYLELPARAVTDTVDLRQNNGYLTPTGLVIPAGFSMPNTATAFRLGSNALGSLPAGLTSALGVRLLARTLDFSGNALNVASVDALVAAVFSGRTAFAAGAKTLLLGGVSDTNASPTGTYQQPAGYVPGMSTSAMNTAAAAWSAKEKLWVLATAFSWTLTYTP